MNSTRSFANNPRVVKEENPNRARIKKKTPIPKRSVTNADTEQSKMLTKAILEATDRVGNIMVEQPT